MVDRLVAVNDADYKLPAPVLAALATDLADPTTPIGEAAGVGVPPSIRAFSANLGGADPSGSSALNREAINSAINDAATAGGGTVTLSPGAYTVDQIVLDNYVHLDLTGVTLISPDGLADVVGTRQRDTTATSTGATLTVASTSGVRPGCVCAVQYAGGIQSTQVTTLTGAIDGSQTTGIILANVTGLASAGILQIGTELIRFTSRSGATLAGVTRGAFGTTAASHTTSDPIGIARRHYANVLSVSGNTVVIDQGVSLPVTGVQASFGIVGAGIVGRGLIDGNKIPTGAVGSVYGVNAALARGCTFDVRVQNTDQGGFMLSRGASDNHVPYLHLHNCGLPGISKGSALWLYQATKRNEFDQVLITGHVWVSIYLDDRTTTNEEGWDGPNVDNVFWKTAIDVTTPPLVSAVNIVSSHRNKFVSGTVKTSALGIAIAAGEQGVGHVDSVGNEVTGLTVDALQAWNVLSPGNNLHDNFVTASTNTVGTIVAGNSAYANSTTPGGAPSIPMQGQGGTGSGAPGFSFIGDPNTGMYSDSADVVGLTAGGVAALRAFGTEARFYGSGKQTVVHSTGFMELTEMAGDASAPTADKARVFARDNGAGKTQLVARFPSGAVQVLATEP